MVNYHFSGRLTLEFTFKAVSQRFQAGDSLLEPFKCIVFARKIKISTLSKVAMISLYKRSILCVFQKMGENMQS